MYNASQQDTTTAPFGAPGLGSFPNVENQAVKDLLQELLINPTHELRARPSHQFRSKLVAIGAALSDQPFAKTSDQLEVCSQAIEYLHLGSLIVDDIQDGSPVRRNGPSLHSRLGVPHALSVGNWLYFRALRLLEKLELNAERRHMLDAEWHEAIELAHYGQVMDLSVSIEHLPQSMLSAICHHCALYKTGSITALAIGMGALIQGASMDRVQAVKRLGSALGVYLQRLNDIGNVVGSFDTEKRYEDLLSRKPSYIWSLTLEHWGAQSLGHLLEATKTLPKTQEIESWLNRHDIKKAAQEHAGHCFNTAVEEFQVTYPHTDMTAFYLLKNRIQTAYA
ncbi:MAG: polyprenyl synthetase family protein [Chitinophagaceae bacterium]|nr:polyprenyl synthetase family protein [Oligoflexus sp.]